MLSAVTWAQPSSSVHSRTEITEKRSGFDPSKSAAATVERKASRDRKPPR